MSKDKFSVIHKYYDWPDLSMANGSGNCTHAAKLIAATMQVLGETIHDFAKIAEQRQGKRYGLYQVCPLCNGNKFIPGSHYNPDGSVTLNPTCTICKGEGIIVRPKVKE